jgi:hypothetical protein
MGEVGLSRMRGTIGITDLYPDALMLQSKGAASASTRLKQNRFPLWTEFLQTLNFLASRN